MSISMTPELPETTCRACGAQLFAPEWSESAAADRIVHIWNCMFCGERFETIEANAKQRVSDAETIEHFWPTLLIS